VAVREHALTVLQVVVATEADAQETEQLHHFGIRRQP